MGSAPPSSAKGGGEEGIFAVGREAGKAAAGGGGGENSTKPRNRPRVLVFVNEIKRVRELAAALGKRGIGVGSLHGERTQREREEV